MKAIKFLIICFLGFNSIKSQTISKASIDSACKLLVELTDEALVQKKYDQVVIFTNAFSSLKAQRSVEQKYIDYFKSVCLSNLKLMGDWIIYANSKTPQRPKSGFYNIEELSVEQVLLLEKQISEYKKSKNTK